MVFTEQHIATLQRGLNTYTDSQLEIDGLLGPVTLGACRKISVIPAWWSEERLVTGALQYICEKVGIDAGPIDGFWGPQTQFGFEQLVSFFESGEAPTPWRDEKPPVVRESRWPVQSQDALEAFYGEMGENQVRVSCAYPMLLAWDTTQQINSFFCHEKVEVPIREAFEEVLDHYGLDRIHTLRLDLFGGCLAVRKMRGGTQWSTHSWGIAIDIDPAHNQLRWGADRASLARPEYEPWWQIWEAKGATSLGRCKGYDYMHLQFADIDC